jgi:hypothetical protein
MFWKMPGWSRCAYGGFCAGGVFSALVDRYLCAVPTLRWDGAAPDIPRRMWFFAFLPCLLPKCAWFASFFRQNRPIPPPYHANAAEKCRIYRRVEHVPPRIRRRLTIFDLYLLAPVVCEAWISRAQLRGGIVPYILRKLAFFYISPYRFPLPLYMVSILL